MGQIKPLTFILVCALSFSYVVAKADNNGNGKGHGYGRDKQKHETKEGKKVPIDGGISLLLAAGAALGAKRVFQKKQADTPVT